MPKKKKTRRAAGPELSFNHAMIYTRDCDCAVDFYACKLGFRLIERFPGYARLRSPAGNTTIALHLLGEGVESADAPGIRLYFEIKQLKAFCQRLAAGGVVFKQMPKPMPWGWTHAYLNDPDGHEISLYWAGAKRLSKSR